MKKLYCGVDIHKEKYVGCIMDKGGKVIREGSFLPTKESAESFLCGMPVEGVAIEACGMWRAAMKIFRQAGYEIRLTSPKKVKDIVGKKKTDEVDAKTLANLLRTGFLPEVYVANDKMLELLSYSCIAVFMHFISKLRPIIFSMVCKSKHHHTYLLHSALSLPES